MLAALRVKQALPCYYQLHGEPLDTWSVSMVMENGDIFTWNGIADDKGHAEGLAIADAIAQTGEQVSEIIDSIHQKWMT